MGVTLPVEGRGGKEMQTSFSFVSIYPRAWQQQRGGGGGIEKKCKRPVLMFSCSHVLPLRRIPGLLIRFLGRLSLLLRLGIA